MASVNERASIDDQSGSISSENNIQFITSDIDTILTPMDTPNSPLSDYPDDLSECSEARAHHPNELARTMRTSETLTESTPHYTQMEGLPAGNVTCTQPRTPERATRAQDQHGLPTPPDTLSFSSHAADNDPSSSSTPIKANKKSQRANAHQNSKVASQQDTTPSAVPSILRRSGRSRRPPVSFIPPPQAPKKDQVTKKSQTTMKGQITKKAMKQSCLPFRIRSDLARPTTKEPTAFPGLAGLETLNKRKRDDMTYQETNDGISTDEEPALQRLRQDITPAPFVLQFTPCPMDLQSQNVPISPSQDSGQVYNQTIGYNVHYNTQNLTPLDLPELQGAFSPSFAPYQPDLAPDATENFLRDLSNASRDDLAAITKQLLAFRYISTADKPDPISRPEVWAATRPELCETLPYFRSYKSASQTSKFLVKGFMFADNAHPRDFTDSSVVISRAGGGMEYDPNTGTMKVKKDQEEPATLAVLRRNMVQLNPVVIITANSNPCIPSKVPHEFCVLDHFKPTNIWAEKTGGKKFWRLRFEKLNTKKLSWWQPKDTSEIAPLGSLGPPFEQMCPGCLKESQQIYIQGWMCLNPECLSWWKLISDNGILVEPEEQSLVYDPRFLKQRNIWGNEDHNYNLTSETTQLSGHAVAGEDCSRAHWSGIVCPNCGRCISRLSWKGWECPTQDCGFVKEAPHVMIPAMSIRETFDPLTSSYMPSRDVPPTGGVTQHILFAYNYRIQRYTIPGIDGFVTHFIANKTIDEERGGPDDMFEDLQRHNFHTRHFTVNYGMPYNFIAATSTESFEGAARPIGDSRSRLNWAAKLAIAQDRGTVEIDDEINNEWKRKEFNEVLALGYLEEQRINYHDDGETGLGPTIATLSLGAPGIMKLRMKSKHFTGVSAMGILTDTPPIPECENYDARLENQPALEALMGSDRPSAYKTAERKKMAKDLGLSCKNKKAGEDVLEMLVGHGDIVVMHGAALQTYYEHSVSHAGKLRFALTCRYIDPESLRPREKPTYEVKPDTGDYDGLKLPLPT